MQPKIALLSSPLLGDSVNFLLFANNLSLNGFEVTVFSNILSSMSDWLPQIKVRAMPDRQHLIEETQLFDLVIADQRALFKHRKNQSPEEMNIFSHNFIFYNILGDLPSSLYFDHSERLKEKLPENIFKKCSIIAKGFQNFCLDYEYTKLTIPEINYKLCKDFLKLDTAEKSCGLTPPVSANLSLSKLKNKVLIHPYSPDERKNWPIQKFIKLARLLTKNGYDVAFTASPQERNRLFKEIPDGFEAPLFNSISDLAAYIYESRLLIGNDSGTGHLASALGIPTITISNKGRKFLWRPDISKNIVVSSLVIKIGGNRIWKPFVSVKRVLKAFDAMINSQGL